MTRVLDFIAMTIVGGLMLTALLVALAICFAIHPWLGIAATVFGGALGWLIWRDQA